MLSKYKLFSIEKASVIVFMLVNFYDSRSPVKHLECARALSVHTDSAHYTSAEDSEICVRSARELF